MAKINLLPKEVFNRISAGEVVERPSSVVKELFENAVDSGAHNIVVSVENGGIGEIHVQDDGVGMDKEDLKKAFLPHATSKIKKASDLDFIQTLGFRGEALASIGAVSNATIVSKTENSEAYKITCEGGVIGEVLETMGVNGTSVTVTSLFFNTPARLKFLKTDKGEEKEISSLMEKLILANPYIAVKYYVDGELIKQSYGDGLKDAVMSVYGKEAVSNCYEISTEKNGLFISGFLGNANYYKGNRTYQTIIVNGRYVQDNTISMAVQNAYGNYLMKRQYPFYVLKINVDPSIVDVNVHPRKAEVRFANNQIIYGSVYSVVSKVLDGSKDALDIVVNAPFIRDKTISPIAEVPTNTESELNCQSVADNPSIVNSKSTANNQSDAKTLYNDRVGVNYAEKPAFNSDYSTEYDFTPIKTSYSAPLCDVSTEKGNNVQKNNEADDIFKANKAYIEKLEAEKKSSQVQIESDLPVKYIGQALGTYLINECGDELIIIDQHAAHERLLFDNFYALVKTRRVVTQSLLVPFLLSVNDDEYVLVSDMLELFKEVGFDIKYVGENAFMVYAVPLELSEIDLGAFFKDVLTDDRFKNEKIPTVLREAIAQKACKSAIKSGDSLSSEEVNSLMERLKQNWNLKCPHGRPVAIKITRTEIDKWFKRIV